MWILNSPWCNRVHLFSTFITNLSPQILRFGFANPPKSTIWDRTVHHGQLRHKTLNNCGGHGSLNLRAHNSRDELQGPVGYEVGTKFLTPLRGATSGSHCLNLMNEVLAVYCRLASLQCVCLRWGISGEYSVIFLKNKSKEVQGQPIQFLKLGILYFPVQ